MNLRIKELRQSLQLSQAKFAKAIAVSNGYIAGIELGKRTVNDRMVMLICATFHVREDWLRNGEGSMFEQELEQELEQLKHLFGQLRPEFKEYVLKELQNLLELQDKADAYRRTK
ncbi:helix-turn-helix domain-containing protein [Anaeromassilibacillus sp. SJQ-5]